MPLEKPTVERLWALLPAYKYRFKAADMLLLLRDTFLDVVHIQKADYIDGKRSVLFPTDEDTYEFASIVMDGIKRSEETEELDPKS